MWEGCPVVEWVAHEIIISQQKASEKTQRRQAMKLRDIRRFAHEIRTAANSATHTE